MANWLKNILDDVERKRSMRPDWMRSEEAKTELARLGNSSYSCQPKENRDPSYPSIEDIVFSREMKNEED